MFPAHPYNPGSILHVLDYALKVAGCAQAQCFVRAPKPGGVVGFRNLRCVYRFSWVARGGYSYSP